LEDFEAGTRPREWYVAAPEALPRPAAVVADVTGDAFPASQQRVLMADAARPVLRAHPAVPAPDWNSTAWPAALDPGRFRRAA